MSRHVVLLSRDTSLRFALKTLFSDQGTVSELDSPKGWRSLNGVPVDAVVIDLPPTLRKTAMDALQRKFSGPLVVLLDLGEELHDDASRQRCAVLHRPFGMAELWSLLTSDGFGVSDNSAEPSQAGELTEPMPAVGPEQVATNGYTPAPQASAPQASAPQASAPQASAPQASAPQVPTPQIPAPPRSAPPVSEPPASPRPEAPPPATAAPARMGAADDAGPAHVVPPADSVRPVADDSRPPPVTSAAMWEAVDEAPQAVATRLAQRLRADVVALLLDNGKGLLETAGGVGLSLLERRLQVEYGHNVLRELFRVGVGLIDDTERVHGVIEGLPIGKADTLMMVPLVHEGHGFGVLLAGRCRPFREGSQEEFTELEIEALMDFAEDVAPALRSAILLRRIKGQLDLAGAADLDPGRLPPR